MNAQQLKNAILQEAIEGRLVSQDPNDEPASILLERIRKEKERLVKEGKLKQKDLEVKPISEDEIPFEIPESWEWVRLKDIIFGTGAGKSPNCEKRPKSGNEWGVITTTAIQYCAFLPNENKVLPSKFIINELQIVKDKDLLITRAGPKNRTGIVCVVDKPCDNLILSDKTVRIDYFRDYCNPFFLMFALNNPTIHDSIMSATVGMAESQVNISQSSIQNIVVPFPPLAEQKRIVAKIEELMPKVEKYGKAQDELNKLNEELPERLKKSILQEAIEGRLVPQDPNDEPASVLLQKIREEKEQLVKAGKLKKKDFIETPISEDEIPFAIPDTWEWVRLGEISTYANTKKKINAAKADSGIWGLDLEDIERGGKLLCVKSVGERKAIGDKTCFSEGDILYSKLRPYLLKILIAPKDGICTPEIIPFTCYGSICKDYIVSLLKSAYVDDYINSVTFGVKMPRVSTETMVSLIIPLPPLAEQKRIVAKIEQLLGEIDKLKK